MTQQQGAKAMMVVFALCMLWTGTGVSEAQARERDAKHYPASMCKPASYSDKQRMEIKAGGIVANKSEVGPLRLFCPIVRDLMGYRFGDHGNDTNSSWNGLHALLGVSVNYENSHPAQTIRCTVTVQRPEGVPYRLSGAAKQLTKTSSPTSQRGSIFFSGSTMSMGSTDRSGRRVATEKEGYHTLECTLPGKASASARVRLQSYYVLEETK